MVAKIRCLGAAGMLVAWMLAPAAFAEEPLPQEFSFQFSSGVASEPFLELFGPSASQVTRTDENGLRITLPSGRPDPAPVGVKSQFRLHGDFEVTLDFEILAIDPPPPPNGGGVVLLLKFDSAAPVSVSINRKRKAVGKGNSGPDTFAAILSSTGPDGKIKHNSLTRPALSNSGKLRLARSGETLHFLVSDGPNAPFQEIRVLPIGREDVKEIRARCEAGAKQAALDARLVSLNVSAEELPNESARAAARPAAGLGWLRAAAIGCPLLLVALTCFWVARRRLVPALTRGAPVPAALEQSGRRRWAVRLTVAALLLVHAALVLQCSLEDFATFDEIGDLTSGLAIWENGSYELYSVNPPLPKVLASLPVLLAHPDLRAIQTALQPGDRPEWRVGEQFARDNAARYHEYVVLARSVGLIWSLLGALGVYCWGRLLWGQASGLFALAIWCFEPDIITQAHLIKNDLPAAVAALWAGLLLRDHLAAPSWRSALIAGVLLGVAELCKFTLLILYPIWGIVWLGFTVRRLCIGERRPGLIKSAGQFVVICAVSLLMINLGYEFGGTGKQLKDFRFFSESLGGPHATWSVEGGISFGNRFRGGILGEAIVPVPADMVGGIDVQRRGFERNGSKPNKYLRGEWSESGWWYYYLYSAAVKVPLGLWGLLFLALAAPLWSRSPNRLSRLEYLSVWLPPAAIFAFMSMHPSMQPHFRYVLWAFPFLIVGISRAGEAFTWNGWGPRLISGGLLLWAAASYMSVHPHALAYFNELAGGPDHGDDHILSSSLDCGQDLLRLKKWLDQHPEAKPIKVAYFNHFNPRIIGIDFQLPPMGVTGEIPADPQSAMLLGPHPGYFAVSARFTRGAPVFAPDGAGGYRSAPLGSLGYFHRFQPVAKAGYSIFIYHITLEQANQVRREYGLPPLPADWKG